MFRGVSESGIDRLRTTIISTLGHRVTRSSCKLLKTYIDISCLTRTVPPGIPSFIAPGKPCGCRTKPSLPFVTVGTRTGSQQAQFAAIIGSGGMAEWLKAAVLKTVNGVTRSGVRIPLPPPDISIAFAIANRLSILMAPANNLQLALLPTAVSNSKLHALAPAWDCTSAATASPSGCQRPVHGPL